MFDNDADNDNQDDNVYDKEWLTPRAIYNIEK